MRALLSLELIDSPLRTVVGLTVVGLLVVTLVVRPWRPLRTAVGAVAGSIVLSAVALGMQAADLFDGPLPWRTAPWIVVTGALLGVAAVGIASRPVLRRGTAALLAVGALLSGSLAVNAAFGITHTPAALFGVQTLQTAALPSTTGAKRSVADFTPPADMPARGVIGALDVPDPAYHARQPSVYLPPAALVHDPPQLPVMVFMMGQPGSPDPTFVATALDRFAAHHHGIAPIAVVADQLAGDPAADPVCQDSAKYGAVATYMNAVLPAYIRAHFNVTSDPARWTIGGYSNGGACAFEYGAAHPDVWGSVLDVSGNEYPGSENVAAAVADVFRGDRAAFDAAKPAAQLHEHAGAYAGHAAVFTSGSADARFGPEARRDAQLSRDAGMTVTELTVPGAGHVGIALSGGLDVGVDALAPAWGASFTSR